MSVQDRLGLDLIGLAMVVVAANPAISGVVLHEWVGTLLVAPLLIHMVLNWDWVTGAFGRFLGRLRAASRVNLVVDAALFVSVVGVSLSGALVIPGFAASLGLQASPLWHAIHLATSNSTVALLALHLALHAEWIVRTSRRMLDVPPSTRTAAAISKAPMPSSSPRTGA